MGVPTKPAVKYLLEHIWLYKDSNPADSQKQTRVLTQLPLHGALVIVAEQPDVVHKEHKGRRPYGGLSAAGTAYKNTEHKTPLIFLPGSPSGLPVPFKVVFAIGMAN